MTKGCAAFLILLHTTKEVHDQIAEPKGGFYHEPYEQTAEGNGGEGDGYMAPEQLAGGFVASEIAFDELQITTVRTAGNVQNVAHEEGDEADENVPQGVVDDGQCEG